MKNVFHLNFPSRKCHSGKDVVTVKGLELVQMMPNSEWNTNFHLEWLNGKTRLNLFSSSFSLRKFFFLK